MPVTCPANIEHLGEQKSGFHPPTPVMILLFSWFAGWGLLAIPQKIGINAKLLDAKPVQTHALLETSWCVCLFENDQSSGVIPTMKLWNGNLNHKYESFGVISSIICVYILHCTLSAVLVLRIHPVDSNYQIYLNLTSLKIWLPWEPPFQSPFLLLSNHPQTRAPQ